MMGKLPRGSDTESPRPGSAAQPPPGGNETILVVEDDEAVRRLTVRILRRLGYAVVEARDGKVALDLLRDDVPIDLLLSDVVLRGDLYGPRLAELIRERRPEIKVVLMSGKPLSAMVGGDHGDEGARLLRKPFSPRSLAIAIREALADLD